MKAKQAVIDVKSTATRSVRADRVFAKSRRDKLSAQVKHLKTTNNVEKMQVASSLTSTNLGVLKTWSKDQAKHNAEQTELAFSWTSSNLASWKSWTEDQTQFVQQEVAMNRKTIDEQSKELTEKGQQLITARLDKEEQSMVARNYQDTFRRERNELMRLHSESYQSNAHVWQLHMNTTQNRLTNSAVH